MSRRTSGRPTWGEVAVALSVPVGAATLGAGAAAARLGAEQGYWATSYYRLMLASFWYFFDRWVPVAAAIGVAAVLITHLARRFWCPGGRGPARCIVLAGTVILAVVGVGRIFGAVDAWLISRGPSVLLISIDTLRADRLGAYGYERPTSPTIDQRLAAHGVTFEHCYSHSPKTTPSHMSMLTSLYPCVHGIPMWEEAKPGPVLNPSVHTLAEVLKNAGYKTAAFTGRGHVHRSRGFKQGFDVYKHGRQLERARDWLTRHGGRKFFLFFHTYAVHDPYIPPERLVRLFDEEGYQGPVLAAVKRLREGVGGWNPAHRIFWESVDSTDARDVTFVKRLYDAAIRHMDEGTIGPLLDHLDLLDLSSETLVVLTSDHGEAFAEHGVFLHDDLHAETLRVPLILRFPGRLPQGRLVSQRARLIDVMPTILELLRVPPPPVQQGRSLVPFLSDDVAGEEGLWDVASEYSNPAIGRVFESLRRGNLGYIVEGASEQLFDHSIDPEEQKNLALERREDLQTIRVEHLRWQQECRRLAEDFGPSGEVVSPDDDTVRQLRALGYVQ